MIIKIPFKTPSVNKLYSPFRGHMILKKEAREIKKEIAEIVEEWKLTEKGKEYYERKLIVSVEVYENWYCLDGSVKHKDVMNREKFLIDSIFEALGIDDKFIWEITIKKIQSVEEKAIITINVLEEIL